MELSGPGVQYIADNQLYNSIITAHAILMIFFMVKKNDIFNSILSGFYLSYCDFYSAILDSGSKEKISKVNSNNNGNITIGNNNNDNDNKNVKYSKDKYVKILVNDPFNNSSGRRKAAGTTNKLELGILFLKLPKSKKVFMYERV